jgi:hypothetical protein
LVAGWRDGSPNIVVDATEPLQAYGERPYRIVGTAGSGVDFMPSYRELVALLRQESPFIALAIVFLFMGWANIATPLWGDDYCEVIPVGLTGPFAFAWHDYFTWTGRFFVTAITYFVISPDPIWPAIPFDIVNAAIFVCLVRNVIGLARALGGQSAVAERPPLAAAIDTGFVALLLWWLPRDIGEVALWKTGSIDYLWAVTGELWVLRWMLAGNRGNSIWRPLFAFAIATFLETISVLVSALLVVICVWRWRRQRRDPVGLLVGHVTGTICLLAAPGNFVRAGTLAPSPVSDRLAGVFASLGSLFDAYWLAAVAIVVLSLVYDVGPGKTAPGSDMAHGVPRRREIGAIARAGQGWVFVVLMLAYMATLLGPPRAALAARVSFPASIFLICYIVAVFFQRPVTDRHNRIGFLVLLVLLACHMAIVVPDLRYLARIHRTWDDDKQFQAGPDTDVTLPIVRVRGRTLYTRKDLFFEGVTSDPAYFVNRCYAAAMHVRTVRAQ